MLDASWSDAAERSATEKLAAATAADLVRLRCVAPPAVTEPRLRGPRPSPSDADPEIAEAMARDADPWPEAIAVATDLPFPASRAAAEAAWREAPSAEQRRPSPSPVEQR